MEKIKSEWIKVGANEEMVSFAEKCGRELVEGKLTNSKIRSIYGLFYECSSLEELVIYFLIAHHS